MRFLIWVVSFGLTTWGAVEGAPDGAKIDAHLDCEAALDVESELNAQMLLAGAESCLEQQRGSDSTFLLLAGQVRAGTDIELLDPATGHDEVKVAELATILYYVAGGSGDAEILRDPTKVDSLVERLRTWSPDFGREYDPGWEFRSSVSAGRYQSFIRCNTEIRLRQLRWYAQLVQDSEYWVLADEQARLMERAGGAFEVGTDLYSAMESLRQRIERVESRYPLPQGNVPDCEGLRSVGPADDAEFVQIVAGGNGPAPKGLQLFESEDEFLQSPVANLLSEDQLRRVLFQVDFEKSLMFAVTVGPRRNVTGVYLQDVSLSEEFESVSVALMIGVNESDCHEPLVDSYPFLVGSFPRPSPGRFRSTGYSLQNFGDGCRKAIGTESPPIFGAWAPSER